MRAYVWGAPALLVVLACQEGAALSDADARKVLAEVPREKLARLAERRVYFGHQSVGMNIHDGLQAILADMPELRLKQVDARKPDAFATPAIGHAPIGRNEDPLSKVRAFGDALEKEGLGARVDVAFFKFCYIDFMPGADVEKVFAEYKATHGRLREAFPKVKFVHVTSPVTVLQSGPKAWLKKLLGKKLGGVEANLSRERFNALLRAEYGGREPIFDLAAVESTLPDGTRVTFEDGGKRYPALARAYASDGKHLNALGSRWAAAHLVKTLAAIPE